MYDLSSCCHHCQNVVVCVCHMTPLTFHCSFSALPITGCAPMCWHCAKVCCSKHPLSDVVCASRARPASKVTHSQTYAVPSRQDFLQLRRNSSSSGKMLVEQYDQGMIIRIVIHFFPLALEFVPSKQVDTQDVIH